MHGRDVSSENDLRRLFALVAVRMSNVSARQPWRHSVNMLLFPPQITPLLSANDCIMG